MSRCYRPAAGKQGERSMGLMRNIVIVEYDPAWPDRFAEEAEHIGRSIPAVLLRLEHIGSTSVPGLAAKPVIDMLAVVRSLEQLDAHNLALQALGYEAKGELGIAGRRFFAKGTDDNRTHHLHAFEAGHAEIADHLSFRDYLRGHREAACRYADLKRELAAAHRNDVESYVAGKGPLIRELLELSRLDPGSSSDRAE